MLKGLMLAFGCFCVFLLLHVIIFRARRPERRFALMSRLHFLLVLGLVALYGVTPADLWVLPQSLPRAGWLIDLANGVLMQSFLFMGYSMFYFLVDRGFSLRILIEVDQAPGGMLTAQGLAARYSLDQVVGRRLGEMVDIGRVVKDGERFRITPRGRVEGTVFAFLKVFLRLGPGG